MISSKSKIRWSIVLTIDDQTTKLTMELQNFIERRILRELKVSVFYIFPAFFNLNDGNFMLQVSFNLETLKCKFAKSQV